MSAKKNAVANRIDEYRKTKDIPRLQMASALGVHSGNFGMMLRGTRGVTTDLLELFLASYPDVSAEWLMRGEGAMLRGSSAVLSIGGDNNGTASVGNTTTTTTANSNNGDTTGSNNGDTTTAINNYASAPPEEAAVIQGDAVELAVLREKVKSLSAMVEEKERIINILMSK